MEKTQEILIVNPEKALLGPNPTEPKGCEPLMLFIIWLAEVEPTLAPISHHCNSRSLSSGDF